MVEVVARQLKWIPIRKETISRLYPWLWMAVKYLSRPHIDIWNDSKVSKNGYDQWSVYWLQGCLPKKRQLREDNTKSLRL